MNDLAIVQGGKYSGQKNYLVSLPFLPRRLFGHLAKGHVSL